MLRSPACIHRTDWVVRLRRLHLVWLAVPWALAGCAARELLFPKTPSIPRNYSTHVFLADGSPSDLVAGLDDVVIFDLTASAPELGAPAASDMRGFLDVERALSEIRTSRSLGLPRDIPGVPNAEARARALAAFASADSRAAPTPLTALTASEIPPLFVRRAGSWESSSSEVNLWKRAPSPFAVRVIDREARLEADTLEAHLASVAPAALLPAAANVQSFSFKNVFARALFEPRKTMRDGVAVELSGESFQVLVQCARLQASVANGTVQEVTWPRVVILELGTSSETTTRFTLVQNDLEWDEGSGTLGVNSQPSLVEVARRGATQFYVFASRRSADAAHSAQSYWYWRDSSQLFSSRFGSAVGSPFHANLSFASFQVGQNALVVTGRTRILADGSLAPFSSSQWSWFSGLEKGKGSGDFPSDIWADSLSLARISRQDWSREIDFGRRGIHGLDWQSPETIFLRDFDVPTAFSGAVPFAQRSAFEEYCATGAALTETGLQ